jgi:hypothetical protein
MSDLLHRRLRAPQEDGAALIDPPLAESARLVAQNRALLERFDDKSGYRMRKLARSLIVLSAAANSVATYTDAEFDSEVRRPFVLTGHQPELFHPGVWFKNFLASSIAHQLKGRAANLVIDTDIIRSTSIRVPAGTGHSAGINEVAFDAPIHGVPWESPRIQDENRFRAFAGEVHRSFIPEERGPAFCHGILLDQLWPHAIEALEDQKRRCREIELQSADACGIDPRLAPFEFAKLSKSLSSARQKLEQSLGLAISDYPIHSFGTNPPFLQFSELLFTRAADFHALHNAALAEFRYVNHVRSVSHPVPDLVRQDDWVEVPFWVWTFRDLHRRRLFARSTGSSWELSDHHGFQFRCPVGDWWGKALIASGIKLRPRALMTTMYARLVLSDLFIHGIGGAKYDELTDLIIRRFFGIEPPAYVTATATFRLPIERPQVTLDDVRQSARRIRETRYRPEAFLRDQLVTQDAGISQQLESLAAEKREYLAQHDLRRCSQEVFERLDRMNRAMHDLLRPVECELRAEHVQLIELAKRSQLLSSREFSFCLFPSEILPARLLDLCKVMS